MKVKRPGQWPWKLAPTRWDNGSVPAHGLSKVNISHQSLGPIGETRRPESGMLLPIHRFFIGTSALSCRFPILRQALGPKDPKGVIFRNVGTSRRIRIWRVTTPAFPSWIGPIREVRG